MKRGLLILTWAGVLAVLVGGCTQRTATPVAEPEMEYRPQQEPAGLSQAVTATLVDRLVGGLASDDLAVRERARRELDDLCFTLSGPGQKRDERELCHVLCERLEDDGVPRLAKVWMLRQMAWLGGAESVPTLVMLLDRADGQIRELARQSLQENRSDAAGLALRTALIQAHQPAERVALINAVAARRDASSVPHLVRWLPEPEDVVRAAALSALGEIGDPAAHAALMKEWREGTTPQWRSVLLDALLRCTERLARQGEPALAAETYDELLAATEEQQVRMAALRGLVETRAAASLSTLITTIKNTQESEDVRTVAAALTTELEGFAITIALASELRASEPAAQVLLLRALGARGDAAAMPAVTALINSRDSGVRMAALAALGDVGDQRSAVLLARVATEGGPGECAVAQASLARLKAAGVDAALLNALRRGGQPLRVQIIRALTARYCREATTALFRESQQSDPAVRRAALEGLRVLASENDAHALVGLAIAETDSGVCVVADDTVVAVCNRIAEPDWRAEPILAHWERAAPAARARLVRMLARVDSPYSLERIVAARHSEFDEVVDAAVRTLAEWPDPVVMPELLGVVRGTDNQKHRVLALRGYIRLIGVPAERSTSETVELYRTAFELAQRPEERLAVLGGLAQMPSVDALRLAQRCVEDQSLRAEAQSAVLYIAKLLSAVDHEAALAAVAQVHDDPATDVLRRRAVVADEEIRRTAGYVVAWMYAGPYFEEGLSVSDVYEHVFPAEPPLAGEVEWKPLPISDTSRPWVFDLEQTLGGSDRCIYARTWVWSDADRAARLVAGSDDAIKIWLGDELVHANEVYRGHQPFEDQVPVKLRRGWNRLIVKVVQAGGSWGFSCGLTTPDEGPLDGVRISAELPE